MLTSGLVDEAEQEEADPAKFIPLLVSPVVHGTGFLTGMLCSIDVPVRYIYFVQNSLDEDVAQLLGTLEREFHGAQRPVASGGAGAQRLVVARHPENLGFSGSMNDGMAFGMSKPYREVPWFFLVNTDVRFSPGMLAKMVADVANHTAADEARLLELEAEVTAAEANGARGPHVPATRPLNVLRTKYSEVIARRRADATLNYTLVTSPLLPDRIRYASAEERATAFKDHVGFFFVKYMTFMAFGVTRLMLSTTGYLNENFFPAYFEDIDWRWRMHALGFQEMHCNPHAPLFHYNGGTFAHKNSRQEGGYHFMLSHVGSSYHRLRYGNYDRNQLYQRGPVGEGSFALPFNTSMVPVDVWVQDERRHRCVRTGRTADNRTVSVCCYDVDVLRQAGVVSGTEPLPPPPQQC